MVLNLRTWRQCLSSFATHFGAQYIERFRRRVTMIRTIRISGWGMKVDDLLKAYQVHWGCGSHHRILCLL